MVLCEAVGQVCVYVLLSRLSCEGEQWQYQGEFEARVVQSRSMLFVRQVMGHLTRYHAGNLQKRPEIQ